MTTPSPRCWPGRTVISVVPRAAMRSLTAFCAPVPSATMAMTAATPMTMPSMVSAERSLFARKAPRATLMISPRSIEALRPSARPAAAARAASGAAAAAPAALHARDAADVAPEALVLLLALRLNGERGEEGDTLALAEPAHHFRV